MSKRVIVVGCSRSGTTILMDVLSQHFDLSAFEETEFMLPWVNGRPHYRHRYPIGKTVRAVYRALRASHQKEFEILRHTKSKGYKLLTTLFKELGPLRALQTLFSKREACKNIAYDFDQSAALNTNEGWVEKTARHFLAVDIARQFIPELQVIHVIRPPHDVIASLIDRARSKPTRHGKEDDIDWATDLWIKAASVAIENQSKENYHLLMYTDFVEDPVGELQKLENLLGLKGTKVTQNETTPYGVTRPSQKYDTLFTESEKQRINKKLELAPSLNDFKERV
jgi:hypothetical protein